MIKLNPATNSIEIVETLTFEHTIKPIFMEFFEDLRENIEYDKVYEIPEKKEHVQRFINKIETNGITSDIKNDILSRLMEEYDNQSYSDDKLSIFDEDFIRNIVDTWFEEEVLDDVYNK